MLDGSAIGTAVQAAAAALLVAVTAIDSSSTTIIGRGAMKSLREEEALTARSGVYPRRVTRTLLQSSPRRSDGESLPVGMGMMMVLEMVLGMVLELETKDE